MFIMFMFILHAVSLCFKKLNDNYSPFQLGPLYDSMIITVHKEQQSHSMSCNKARVDVTLGAH